VIFDSGGLDLKPAANMKLMKKDMGGAALVLGVAHVVMSLNWPIRLRVLVPAVENSIGPNAMRPLDVLRTRKGLTVEVGNTDAEGRLILSDALAAADEEQPELLIDAATLTGAARTALGTSLPALFSNHDETAAEILAAGLAARDPLWRLPLHQPYAKQLESPVADLCNVTNDAYGGAITAALFLERFVSPKTRWAHIDTMGWNLDTKPGRPAGGEAFALRALVELLRRRYAAVAS
jgi:leucyl aminopeptidase